MLRAVLFDLDDTLMPDESAADEALIATAQVARQWHNIPPADLRDSVRRIARHIFRANAVVARYDGDMDISSWEALSSTFEGDDADMKALREWAPWYRHEVWFEALARNGVADPFLADQLSALYPAERRARYRPYPDAVPCLEELKPLYRLGLVTNGPCDLQCEKIERSGLGPWFEVAIASRQVGFRKPDPRIFQLALGRMEIDPADAVYVGDTPRHDVVGARAAGLKAVWLNRGNRPKPDGIEPDAVVATLTDLLPVVSRF